MSAAIYTVWEALIIQAVNLIYKINQNKYSRKYSLIALLNGYELFKKLTASFKIIVDHSRFYLTFACT